MSPILRIFLAPVAATWLAAGVVACGGDPVPLEAPVELAIHHLSGDALGTGWNVKWREVDGVSEDDVRGAVETALAQVDKAMSTWRDDSELSQIRAADGPILVSEETYQVVDAALVLAAATDGAFDPTVQPLMELWGFHGEIPATWPTEAEIEAARAQTGWDKVALGRDDALEPYVGAGGTALDLSAIAKGHAVDRVSLALSGMGLPDHLVEVGGEVRVHGRGPSGPTWKLGIDKPAPELEPGTELVAVVGITNNALATSGNYRSFHTIAGKKVHHTMDPRTGRPAASSVLSATVVAPDCRTADGWATALMVLPVDQGLALIEARPDIEALLLVDGMGGMVQRPTSGMARHLVTETTQADLASPE